MAEVKTKDALLASAGIVFMAALAWNYHAPAAVLVSGAEVLPEGGIELPIVWSNMGREMVAKGVIDMERMEEIYAERGGITEEGKKMLLENYEGKIVMTKDNAGILLNILWGFGLANKNTVLETGPMANLPDGRVAYMASTGGWTLAKNGAMDHYNRYEFVKLTAAQEKLVERVSQNIYRPCCGNPTYFPDCNHGMAMLGLLELMAANGVSEEKMYMVALAVNSYWFPDTYLTLAKYFAMRGVAWDEVDPKTVLSSAYSGAQGYRQILQEVEPPQQSGGPGCGV